MARLAAHVLMEDVLNAMNINGWFYRGFERTQRKLKRGSKIMETTELAMAQSVEETIEWRKAVNFISDLVRKNHDTDVLRTQLTVTYKRQGYR
ncbi:hypothetical protein CJU94_05055 [Paraburkholderia aromaticivorans]|uniref:Uncharacterized protein n=2 Tax=Paraburkholderia aromaticivorans TaxID=2026199 RepID=A0A248VEX1_9BURK|nr:hypothetical protein CJU94_05055 [Paraburkholderia aromaticivorans]